MIFHTAADPIYYEKFYDYYSYSIKKFYPTSKLSLYFVGNRLPANPSITYLKHKDISFSKIQQIYSADEKNAKGYYALARWLSMPLDDDIVVSDTDIIAIKPISLNIIKSMLKDHEVINITRTKKGGSEGGMAMMIIRKDVVSNINNKAKDVLHNHKLQWDSDVQVRSFIYNNYNVAQMPEMHVFGKNTNYETFDNTSRSFAIFKGRIGAKCASLEKAVKKI
jgi:hypothetical protein